MKCTFMHGRIPVADIEIDDATGFIQKTETIYEKAHLPVGIPVRDGIVDRALFNEWWTDRAIPASRLGVREALENLNIANTKMLLLKCFGLSLSDGYWICPKDSGITWENVNFFDNDFSEDIGDILFGETKKDNIINFSSPDNTSDGNLKKRWKIINGKRCLIKGGSNPFMGQPFNEVIAYKISQKLKIDHIPYWIMWDKGLPYSVCEDFVTRDTELITAWRIMQTQKKSNSTSVYQHFVNCCNTLGIDGAIPFLDRMITLDYIIANEDRHFNNFGVLRDIHTLEWLGFAPIYDSGSSLGYDKLASQIYSEQNIGCKPFKNKHTEQLKLVSSFDWVDFNALSEVRNIISETMSDAVREGFANKSRIDVIARSVKKRIDNLQKLSWEHTNPVKDTTDGDVQKNVAKTY